MVPVDEFEQAALDAARSYAGLPSPALQNALRLLKRDQEDLKGMLELEDRIVINRFNAPEFPEILKGLLERT